MLRVWGHGQKATKVRQNARKRSKKCSGGHAKLMAIVRRAPQAWGSHHLGKLILGCQVWSCALGKTGISSRKREGDGATPRAYMPVLYGCFRADRVHRPIGGAFSHARPFWQPIGPKDGWGDAPFTPNYNRPVALPFKTSHEKMMREDGLYNRLIVLDWNISTRRQLAGSAIFFHQAKIKNGKLQGTLGCVAIDQTHFVRLAPRLAKVRAIKVL